jgi:hypothetical protein
MHESTATVGHRGGINFLVNGKWHKVHDFRENLTFSKDEEISQYLNDEYDIFFSHHGGLIEVKLVNRSEQERGDKELVFADGSHIFMEEKIRRVTYDDVLLEVCQVEETGDPGWIDKSRSDYIAYFNVPTTLKIFPTPLLRLAWMTNRDEWLNDSDYFQPHVKFRYHGEVCTTHNIAIPTEVLLRAIIEEIKRNA